MDSSIHSTTAQTITGQVQVQGMPQTFWITFVYGLHTAEDRQTLWTDLEGLHSVISDLWITMGDYCAVLNAELQIIDTIKTLWLKQK